MKLLLTKSEAADALGTGVDFIRSLVETGAVGFVQVGNDERVPVEELDRWCRAEVRYRECRSGPAKTVPQAPGGSTSGLPAKGTGSRSGRRTNDQPRPWNAKPSDESKPSSLDNVAQLPSRKPSPDTGRSTDNS